MLTDEERHERKLARQRAYNKRTHYAATNNAKKANVTQVSLPLHKVHDADIIEKLGSVGNKAGYIKSLIREDLKNNS